METILDDQEIRVLGCLMEKSMATPDYYPLSLNALTNACNQKSNRDPVVDWNEDTVEDAVGNLCDKHLVNKSSVGRVPKYEETFTRQHNMVNCEAAVLCTLFLRGPQTPGAIRSRSERLHAFDSLDSLQETLDRLDEWGLIQRLDRLPGHKEARYTHLLCGDPGKGLAVPETVEPAPSANEGDRLERLEATILSLQEELADLRATFESFRQQFE